MNGTRYTYTFGLKDLLSGKLNKLAATGRNTYSKLAEGQRRYNQRVREGSHDLNHMGSLTRRLGLLFKTYLGYRAGVGFLRLGADMESTRISFQTLLGSVESGNALFEAITRYANITPFANKDLQQAARTMLSFGIAGDSIMGNLQMLGDVAGGNSEKMRLLTLAFSQTQSAGKLMGQDLLQYVNAGFNPLQIISQKTGKSLAYLRDEMQKGNISAAMVSDAFRIATSEGGLFYKMMEKQSQTMSGKWSTVVGKFTDFIGRLSSSQNNVFTSILDKGISVLDFLNSHLDTIISKLGAFAFWVKANVTEIASWAKVVVSIIAAYKAVIFVSKLWAAANMLVNLTNPWLAAAYGIAALVGVFVWAWNKFDKFRAVIMGIWGAFKELDAIITTFIVTRIKEMINAFTGLGKVIRLIFKGKFGEAVKEGGQLFNNLFGINSTKHAFNSAKNVGAKYREGFDKGMAGGGKVLQLTKLKDKFGKVFNFTPDVDLSNPNVGGNGGNSGGGTGDLGASITSGINSITGGGSRPLNVNVDVGKLVETINLHSSTVKEGVEEIRDMITEQLLRVLNSSVKISTGE